MEQLFRVEKTSLAKWEKTTQLGTWSIVHLCEFNVSGV